MTAHSSFGEVTVTELLRPLWVLLLRHDSKSLCLNARRLASRNERLTNPVVAPDGPVVSMTTYGDRLNTVHLALESIAEGAMLPSRMILWLDDEVAFRNRSSCLRRLEDRGLEILLTENYGPHKKYYPYVDSTEKFSTPLVTADDDCLYPASWLSGLANSFNDNPEVVSCYRAHTVGLIDNTVAPYSSWAPCKSSEPSFLHFATGCSGTIYPARLLKSLKAAGNSFRVVCPKADDVWLHAQALRAGIKIRQVGRWPLRFPIVPGTEQSGLFLSNVSLGQNDRQIKATYTPADIQTLASELCVAQSSPLMQGHTCVESDASVDRQG
jgi:hypothetical protein